MMKVDLVGRIGNIPLGQHRPLLPLFEAVVNSIHAIQDRQISDGSIEVFVKRDHTQSLLSPDITDTRPITDFFITDNGIGFDKENYESFKTSDTKHKQGAKGIGRFMWLKAFEAVRITSIYASNGQFKKRSFNFVLSHKGIEDENLLTLEEAEPETKVQLMAYKEKYQKSCPRHLELIAERLIEHCLIYFLSPNCPRIIIEDSQQSINLNDLFNSNVRGKTNKVSFNLRNVSFELTHLRLYFSNERNHEVHICANDRVVESLNLGKRIPNLNAKLHDKDGNQFKYAACVVSKYLDENVNVERTGFNIPTETELSRFGGLMLDDMVSMEEIETGIMEKVSEFLEPSLRPIKEDKNQRIAHFVTTKAPQFRSAIKYMGDSLDQIPPDLPEDKLEIELYRIKARLLTKVKEDTQKLIEERTDSLNDVDEYLTEHNNLLSQISDMSTDQLAEYILYRKAIISLLDKSLALTEAGKYPLEETVHRIIFPMRTTSDDIDYEKQNLWLIDERLSYHHFLASDKRLDSIDGINSDSKERPDILIFNKALAYADADTQYTSIVIIEFKRPMRDAYAEEDNPFEQISRYITDLREKKEVDRTGRPIRVNENTPFYAYIICDITPKIGYWAEKVYDYTPTPDGEGYFNFNKNQKAYIEVISYNKLRDDAKKRNRVLFEKLNLPSI